MDAPVREMEELECALLRRSVDDLEAGRERCGRCRRTPLIGERVYDEGSGAILCELCKSRGHEAHSRLIHGPEFGHTIRVTDHRRAA
jgi:hypothetical protein